MTSVKCSKSMFISRGNSAILQSSIIMLSNYVVDRSFLGICEVSMLGLGGSLVDENRSRFSLSASVPSGIDSRWLPDLQCTKRPYTYSACTDCVCRFHAESSVWDCIDINEGSVQLSQLSDFLVKTLL